MKVDEAIGALRRCAGDDPTECGWLSEVADEIAALQAVVERLTPQFTGKPDEAALHTIKAKCAQMWNERGVGSAEFQNTLEFIYRHACDAERRHDALREAADGAVPCLEQHLVMLAEEGQKWAYSIAHDKLTGLRAALDQPEKG